MRIGELAALVGVSTRTVRHYHRIGVLPEPPRQPNGYRSYTLRDAVLLTRIRRLTELGLNLDEIKDVLADDAGKELHDVLHELDADLAAQQEAIRERRTQVARLLEQAANGGLPAEGPVSPELAAVFKEMARVASQLPGPEPAMAAKERELFAMLDGVGTPESREWLTAMLQSLRSDPAAIHRAYELYARMDELAHVSVDDPRVGAVAQAIADALPDDVATALVDADHATSAARQDEGRGFVEAFLAEYSPAQAEAIRQAVRLLQERSS